MIAKRLFDLLLVVPGVLLLLPLMLFIAAIIKLDSPGPALFRQERVGRHGRSFEIFKFRTMAADARERGPNITVGTDSRITRVGRTLRKYKLDELPQLLNVLRGEMSLVGPRPEVAEFVDIYPTELRDVVLSVPPGLTDYAAIEFRSESEVLGAAADPRACYVNEVLPKKLALYARYVRERSLGLDMLLIARTIVAILRS